MMRFTVANWHRHHDDPQWWIEHNGYTTMTSPPEWAKVANRNLDIFAPPEHIVFDNVSQDHYKTVYRRVLQSRMDAIRVWVAAHDGEHVILLCACPGNSMDERFCHRYLIAKVLTWLGCEEVIFDENASKGDGMRVISLWQPYASLIAQGQKQIETRSWPAPPSLIGQRIAIHAAKKWDRALRAVCQRFPFREDIAHPEDLPRGAIIATAILTECRSTNGDWVDDLSEREYEYGDYSPDRFGWFLSDVECFLEPIPAQGKQGIWIWQREAVTA